MARTIAVAVFAMLITSAFFMATVACVVIPAALVVAPMFGYVIVASPQQIGAIMLITALLDRYVPKYGATWIRKARGKVDP